MLSEIDMGTVSPLDWIMAPESDRSVGTGWNALSEADTLPLDSAPTTAAAPLALILPVPEKNITVSILTDWGSPNQEDSLDQETGSAAHIGPTTAKPLITPLFSGHDSMVGNGGSLNAIAEGETALISSSTPTALDEHDGGGLVLHPSNMPSSRSRNFAKTEEICDSGLCGTTARPMKESRTTSTSIIMVPEKPAVPTDTPTVPHGPEGRPSTTTTTTSDTATSAVGTDSILDQLQRAQPISRQNVGVATGAVSAGIAFFILTFVLHRFVYRWVGRRRTGVIRIGREPSTIYA
ncbi:hypothetical protein BDW62DRAFT_188582 [Aspergillus aurantiobrunneus]